MQSAGTVSNAVRPVVASCSDRSQCIVFPAQRLALPRCISAQKSSILTHKVSQRCTSARRVLAVSPVAAAAQGAKVGKLISKTEIPAFIPRSDLMEQLVRWARIEAQMEGVENFGLPMKVTDYRLEEEENRLWGFNVTIIRDGVTLTQLGVRFDFESNQKHQYVGQGSDGFPLMEGMVEEIMGKNLEIW